MVRELDKIIINGIDYYVDERLCQLRQVHNPHKYIDFQNANELSEYLLNLAIIEVTDEARTI